MPPDPLSSCAALRRLRRGVALLCLLAAPAAAQVPCAAWPGEPSPLPTVADPDPARARYAELRRGDLALRADAIEARQPAEAHRLWRHAACLDPDREALRRAALRTRPIRLHRPGVLGAGAPPPRVADGADAWAVLGEPVVVSGRRYVDPEARAAARAVLLGNVDARLAEAEERLRRARFRDALVVSQDVRGRLERMRQAPDLAAPWVRLEVLTATAELALGDEAAARASLERALAAQPDLTLDAGRTPPKLLRAFEAARTSAGGAAP